MFPLVYPSNNAHLTSIATRQRFDKVMQADVGTVTTHELSLAIDRDNLEKEGTFAKYPTD